MAVLRHMFSETYERSLSARQLSPRDGRSGSRVGLLAGTCVLLAVAALANIAVARRSERVHPPRGKFVTIEGVRLHYLEGGSGPAVVLLHGNGATAEDWQLSGVIDALAHKHRVIAFDRPGYGYSDRPRDRLWTAEVQAEMLYSALQQLGCERPLIVGHSWGTLPALHMAFAHPEIAGLVLVSGYYFPSWRLDVALGIWPGLPIIGDLLRYTISPALGWLCSRHVYKKIFAPLPVPKRFNAGFPLGLALRPWQIRASGADTGLMIPAAATAAKRYQELRMPVAVLAGDGDHIVSTMRQSKRLAAETSFDLRLISGAGHMVHYFAPDEVLSSVETIEERGRAQRAD
jgi:pimeloyl-ACP methyl ester carboxylesterase